MACRYCGGFGTRTNLRGGTECSGCAAPSRKGYGDFVIEPTIPAQPRDFASTAALTSAYSAGIVSKATVQDALGFQRGDMVMLGGGQMGVILDNDGTSLTVDWRTE